MSIPSPSPTQQNNEDDKHLLNQAGAHVETSTRCNHRLIHLGVFYLLEQTEGWAV